MNLLKAGGTIGGLTMVSRIAGFAREMLMARILGAGMAADAFVVAFRLPNTFRRFFGEGAFSAGFVPLFSQRLNRDGGMEEARRFSEEVLAIFLPALLIFTVVFEIIMPVAVFALAPGYYDDPEKFGLAVVLSRLTFPYLLLISLVSLYSGILNSMGRFAAAAFAPALLNVAMIGALLLVTEGGAATARALAIGVTVGGVIQLVLLWGASRAAGISLRPRRPRITPGVRQFIKVVIPATIGAGVYQLSILIDTQFASFLPEGSLAYLNYADRLNQLPLSVIGTALGTAILPAISRHIDQDRADEAARVQAQALELSMLLSIPAALALSATAVPLVTALFMGGEFTRADALVTGTTLGVLVLGLPAYVLVKVLTPGFYAREDTKTPVKIAGVVLIANVILNFALIPFLGIYGLALALTLTAWLNCSLLYSVLHRRGHFSVPGWLVSRIARQLAAGAVMVATLLALRWLLVGWFAGSVLERLVAVSAVVGIGMIVYFTIVWFIGGMDQEDVRLLLRRKKRA